MREFRGFGVGVIPMRLWDAFTCAVVVASAALALVNTLALLWLTS